MIAGNPASWDDFFAQDLIPVVLELVVDAWGRIQPPPRPHELENDISRKLYSEMVNGKDRSRHPFLIRYEDVEVNTNLAAVTGRKDIVVFPSHEEDIYFCLEAKRLNAVVSGSKQSRAAQYVKDGLQRFVDAKYSRSVRHGGMLGYVLDGNIARAIRNIRNNIKTQAVRLGMTLPGQLCPSTIRPADKNAKETTHSRPTQGDTICVHHLLLAPTEPSPV